MTRFGWFMSTYFAAFGIGLSVLFHPLPHMIWNASASVPIGLYDVRPAGRLHDNELVVVRPPEPLASFLADRDYLPEHVPLLKHIAALAGQRICRTSDTVSLDGHVVGIALDRDSRHRLLPRWSGCRMMAGDQIFLLNQGIPDSLDGRYFGPLPVTSIVGQAVPLWIEKQK